jgi:hypothetical protein
LENNTFVDNFDNFDANETNSTGGDVKENKGLEEDSDDFAEFFKEDKELVKTKFSLNPGKGKKKSSNRLNWKSL